jgi:hypothetical protein
MKASAQIHADETSPPLLLSPKRAHTLLQKASFNTARSKRYRSGISELLYWFIDIGLVCCSSACSRYLGADRLSSMCHPLVVV